jgi:hypothetical protein
MEGYLNKAPSFMGQWRRRYFAAALLEENKLGIAYYTGPDKKVRESTSISFVVVCSLLLLLL